MAFSQTQRKALQWARATRPTEPINTFIESFFLAKIAAQRQNPLVDDSSELFIEHLTGAAGLEVLVPPTAPWTLWPYLRWMTGQSASAEASAAHEAELQALIAALEERIANPVDKQTTISHIGSASTFAFQATLDTTLNNAS